jgi:hypothetical protein
MTQDIQPVFRAPLGPRIAPVQGQKSAARGAESAPAPAANAVGHDVAGFERTQRLARSQDAKEAVQATLGQLRDAGRQAEQVGQRLREANDELAAIVKRYPPFPPGSPERDQHLAKYAALRQVIEQLTYPKPPEQPALADAGLQSGAAGLGLPELSPQTSDANIAVAQVAVEAARHKVSEARERFSAEADHVIETRASGRAESEGASIGLSLAARRFFALGSQGIAQHFEPALFGR